MAEPQLRVPSAETEIERLFAGWREELATCRKFAPAARDYAAAWLEADVGLRVNDVGLRVNEVCLLDLDDVRELGRFGKLNARHGEGSPRKGPRPQLVPLILAPTHLRWFIEDVWGQFGDDHGKRAELHQIQHSA